MSRPDVGQVVCYLDNQCLHDMQYVMGANCDRSDGTSAPSRRLFSSSPGWSCDGRSSISSTWMIF